MNAHRLRVLFNSPNPSLHGGPPTHLPLLEEALRKHIDVDRFDYGRKSDSETVLHKVRGRCNDLILLRSKIRTFQPDLIHHNTAFDRIAILRDAPLVWLAKRYKIPVLLKMHGSLNESFEKMDPILGRLRSSLLKNASCIGVLSGLEMETFLKAWAFLNGRLRVVKNIIHSHFYEVAKREAKRPTLLFMSRFIRKKGVFDLLQAVPGVLEALPSARFIFVGSGSDSHEFDKRVKEKRLSPCVRRIDHISNVNSTRLYSRAWAFVFPTHFPEGMPMVVAQAMAAGVPIITTRTRFSLSYMSSEDHCLFVDHESPRSIVNKIVYLCERADLRRHMSKNNRQLAGCFRGEIVAQNFVNIYRELIDMGAGIGARKANDQM